MSQGELKPVARDPVDVLHMAIKAHPDGIPGAAKRIGRSAGGLYNKLAQSMPEYDLMFREAMALAHFYSGTAFPESVAEQFGGVFFPLPAAMAGDDDVLQDYLDIVQQMGDLSREFTEARADGIIEPAEFQAMRLRAMRTVSGIMRFLADLEGMVRELPTIREVPTPTSAVRNISG